LLLLAAEPHQAHDERGEAEDRAEDQQDGGGVEAAVQPVAAAGRDQDRDDGLGRALVRMGLLPRLLLPRREVFVVRGGRVGQRRAC